MIPDSTQIYCNYKIVEAKADTVSEYGHTFGGKLSHDALKPAHCGRRIHQLYRFSLLDPLLDLEIPSVDWLPLYYCFDSGVDSFGYRLTSDTELKCFLPDDSDLESGFPTNDFPHEFSASPVELMRVPFDASSISDVEKYPNAFGIGCLSSDDQQRFLAECRDTWNEFAPDPWAGPLEELLRFQTGPTCQGYSASRCPSPECCRHVQPNSMQLLAVLPAEPVSGIEMWGEFGGETQVIFEICPECSAISTTNQCD